MNARSAEIRRYSDIQAQADLARLNAAKQPEPCQFCAEPESDESPAEPSWAAIIAGTVIVLVTWAAFGWAVVTVAQWWLA